MSRSSARKSGQRKLFFTLLIVIIAVLALLALLSPVLISQMSTSLEAGQAAAQDFLAPQAVTYTSEVLTEQKRDAAERAVAPVFTTPDTNIARQQLEKLRTALAYINSVRADTYSSPQQKLSDLAALDDIRLSKDTASNILSLSDARWQAVQQNAIAVLEEVMRNPIRSDNIDAARYSLPSLVSLSLSEEQATVVSELASAFVVSNSLYSESLTQAEREKARAAATPVTRAYIAGERVVSRGKVLDAADVEALQHLGLTQQPSRWEDTASALVLVLLMLLFITYYLRRAPDLREDTRRLTLIALLFLAFLLGARLFIPGHIVLPYAYPLAAYSLIVTILFGAEIAMFTALPLAIMSAYGLPNALDLTLYYALGSLFGVLALGTARRITSFFWAGAAIAISSSAVIVIYRLPQPSTDLLGLTTLIGTAFINGLAAASLTLLMQFFLAQFLGMTTPLQLMELTRPDHPLLQMILHEAPGTYQHSLQVANLAEQAAERVGADPLLTRVGALYHDAGKALNAVFFIENQVPGFLNPHDDLDPLTSSSTIIRHIYDGLELARQYRLPRRLFDFISEHHGTMITSYQYVKAVKAVDGDESRVDKEKFRYPGPHPQSRETAILMLADGCEARVRAERPREEDELHSLIKGVIENRIATGQLADTDLTLKDLELIQQSFLATLRGIYHPRVPYPKLETGTSPETAIYSNPPTVPHRTADTPPPIQ